jgi:FtsP/CotA-like multicopper oxidase with cupredoxin domain
MRIKMSPSVLLPLTLCLLGGSAVAQPAPRLLSGPQPLPEQVRKALEGGNRLKANSGNAERASRELRYNLGIKYTLGTIYNPATNKHDKVHLRSYVPLNEDMQEIPSPAPRFIAPLITMKPGQTVRITLSNQLPPEKDCKQADINTPKCFNTTNLHSHGLWVSPAGNSDNVLLDIKPGVNFQYEYNVPEDHPAGTYWYHPHVHGSTAMQVASGMAGALIIKGDRVPTRTQSGDIDTLLKPFEPKALGNGHDYPEVLLFQQIPYACFQDGKIQTQTPEDTKNPGPWVCGDEDIGEVKDFAQQFGVGKWTSSGRYTSINGMVQPRIQMQAGRVYRWRLIDAGVRESINLRIARVSSSTTQPEGLTAQAEKTFIEQQCNGPVVEQWEIATDGLTRSEMVRRETNRLQPGYRSDVLFAFPEEGNYCLYDAQTSSTGSITAAPENPRLLGWVSVQGGKRIKGAVKDFIQANLLEASNQFADGSVRALVKRDLKDGLKLFSFVSRKDITPHEVRGSPVKEVKFSIGGPKEKPTFLINDKSYSGEGEPEHTLILDTAQEWRLTSKIANHPFHIHVNPFQIISIKDKDGNEVDTKSDPESDYYGMKDAWRDTILVQQDYTVTVRSRYERYIGDFVLHCHILDHEDQGMMQRVRITLPDGQGGAMVSGHNHH